ncbi:DUF3068 domain-containing protein [Streptomyces sp. LX-29]|uniref:DUF3068 domain-containing protein n=1 Tax=Streptomyces sp. LX-29 TaxID=2900152 RepID=UPI00240E3C9D|nr:DUF3068 domain-containing protein [Streptomyces sp. LX-29]WFB10099.1 DUF3068 domain-containing protein [Streptomyces sp. LX-29]
MRRKASLVLLALAVCCAALAPLIRWYAFPRLVKVPPGEYQTAVMEAKPATLLDYSTLRPRRVPKVTIVQTLRGNVEASEKVEKSTGRDVVVWDTLSYVVGPDGAMVSEIPERYVFDAHSQAPVHLGGEHVDGDPVRRDGIEFKWPFLTEPRDYTYFDAQARRSAPIHYRGTRSFRGLEVYYFEQTIPWTRVPLPRKLPVGGVSREDVAQAGTSRWYTTTRRFWVEPVTGAPVNGEEIHREELRGGELLGDRKKVTAFAGHVKMREDYIAHTVELVASRRRLVLLLTTGLPRGLLALGVALFAGSLVLEARARRGAPPGPGEPRSAGPVSVSASP